MVEIRDFVARLDRVRRSLAEEVEDDIAQVRLLSDEERDQMLQRVVRASHSILLTREDWRKVVASEPPAPDFAALWARLRARD